MFELDKVHSAILEMDGEKSPGSDGFTMAFFKNCWGVVKNDLLLVFSEFFDRVVINGSMNSTFIALIPKWDGLIDPKDFKPINLITSVYKIIAKFLSMRIQGVIEEIIASSQGAFVKDRQILDEILIANECVEEMKSKGVKAIICKVDLEKAYDLVNWDFLEYVLSMKGSGD